MTMHRRHRQLELLDPNSTLPQCKCLAGHPLPYQTQCALTDLVTRLLLDYPNGKTHDPRDHADDH